MPTFENKAEALHYFPMWRTWFGLNGLCKLPWNDVVPADNSETDEPAKVPGHVAFYARFFSAMTNIRQGKGLRINDSNPPYRSIGPVTEWEYESRQERYDSQLAEKCGIDCSNMTTTEKLAKLREYRMEQYMCLADAAYKRRGWTRNGVPTMDKIKSLGLDWIPDVVDIVKNHDSSEPPKDTLPESNEGWE
jgi:aldehyde:ferredoxin oxidoreductase